jgi:ubiquinone/menaquinone biosynthesis C-methylase UbiE
MDHQTRAERERSQYNEGSLKRDSINKYFAHANSLLFSRLHGDAKKYTYHGTGKKALELGCQVWKIWFEDPATSPRELQCINISEAELETGSRMAKNSKIKPTFHLMDAHKLEFQNEHFDFIYGGAILHHLDLSIALPEINRVLKPGGFIMFVEPLNINPLSKMIRCLTPKARTLDEHALCFKELRSIGNYFDISLTSYQLFSIPLGLVSTMLYDEADNPVMRFADVLDTRMQEWVPFLKYYYRYALITGYKRPHGLMK